MVATVLGQAAVGKRLTDDTGEFRALFDQHYPTVLRVLRRMTADEAEAEDVAQETFVALGEQRFPEQLTTSQLRAWLVRTGIRRAFNARRGQRRRAAREASVGSSIVPAAQPSPEDVHMKRQVRVVLQELDERVCQLLVLRAVGLSYKELAEVIDVAPGSIGTLLVRAQQTFTTSTSGVRAPAFGRAPVRAKSSKPSTSASIRPVCAAIPSTAARAEASRSLRQPSHWVRSASAPRGFLMSCVTRAANCSSSSARDSSSRFEVRSSCVRVYTSASRCSRRPAARVLFRPDSRSPRRLACTE